jgi:hypothetical protein
MILEKEVTQKSNITWTIFNTNFLEIKCSLFIFLSFSYTSKGSPSLETIHRNLVGLAEVAVARIPTYFLPASIIIQKFI